jgi:F420-non-reducing hydrogenase large subunit
LASGKAVDAVYKTDPPRAAKKLRELLYSAHYVHSHTLHFFALAAPDFVLGPDAKPAERNILGLINKVGLEIGKEVIKNRAYSQKIQIMIAGRATHLVWSLPGGVSKGITEEERKQILEMAKVNLEFAKFALKLFEDVVLKNQAYVDLILSDAYQTVTNYMGLVDRNNKVNFYDGMVRVVNTEAKEIVKFKPADYLQHIKEHVEPWSYLKFPFLKKIGWNGFVEGAKSGIYRAAPLARLNVADGMATPLAQEAYEKYFDTLGGKPVHSTLAMHWARLVELLYAAERQLELIQDIEITDPKVRVIPNKTPDEGVGVVEAPRGTLYHHYKTDDRGMVTKVNLIVGTTNNNAPICMSIRKAAQGLIKAGTIITEGLLNRIEMAFRAYDPCLSCATHSLPGQMPLQVLIRDSQGEILKKIVRD